MTALEIRDGYLGTLNHIGKVFPKLKANLGQHGIFDFPDVHKLGEGLFLAAWTYWEGFLRSLLSFDLATDPDGIIRRDVKQFRYANAPSRLPDRVLNHPHHP